MRYKLTATRDELKDKGFRYNKDMSDVDSDCYSLRFPVLKYNNKITVVECEVTVELQTSMLTYIVYTANTNDVYAPYYDREFGTFTTIERINDKIYRKFKKLGVKKV